VHGPDGRAVIWNGPAEPCRHSETTAKLLIGRGADSVNFSESPLRSLAIQSVLQTVA
jgi:hypothetical protein